MQPSSERARHDLKAGNEKAEDTSDAPLGVAFHVSIRLGVRITRRRILSAARRNGMACAESRGCTTERSICDNPSRMRNSRLVPKPAPVARDCRCCESVVGAPRGSPTHRCTASGRSGRTDPQCPPCLPPKPHLGSLAKRTDGFITSSAKLPRLTAA